jgi:hypothetical protein
MWYLLFYLIGLGIGVATPLESIRQSLTLLEPITLTALVASLLVPFAGFASNERWQKFTLQYALVPLFGIYTAVLWRSSSVVGLVLLVCAASVHAGYWMSGIHSRAYRLEQFKFAFARRLTEISRLVAMLNGQGRSEEADAIVSCILKNKPVDWGIINRALAGNPRLLAGVKEELSEDGRI